MKAKAILNPVAGRNSNRSVTDDMVVRLTREGILSQQDLLYTSASGNTQLDANFFDHCDTLIVAGGDGTLHYAVNQMKRCQLDLPIAYLPTGTTNDFGNALHLPRTAAGFCKMLHEGKTREIDLGMANGTYFHYVVSAGPVIAPSYDARQPLKNKIGKGAYFLSTLRNLPSFFRGVPLKLEWEEKSKEETASLLLISKSQSVGGFSKIIPDAKFDDGLLHVLLLRKNPLIKSAILFLSILRGTHLAHPDVTYFQTKKITLTQGGSQPSRYGIDGEQDCGHPVSIEVMPKGMTILIPSMQ